MLSDAEKAVLGDIRYFIDLIGSFLQGYACQAPRRQDKPLQIAQATNQRPPGATPLAVNRRAMPNDQ